MIPLEKSKRSKQKEIEDKAVKFVLKYERSKNRKPKDVRSEQWGYDVESKSRKIEVKGTEADIPNKGGLHITLLPRQYRALKENLDYWIYRVYNVREEGKEKMVQIPRNEILVHLTRYTVHKLTLKSEEWKKLEEKSEKQ